jgi:hypothetical protein
MISREKCSYKGKLEQLKKHCKAKHDEGDFRCDVKGCPEKPEFKIQYDLERH